MNRETRNATIRALAAASAAAIRMSPARALAAVSGEIADDDPWAAGWAVAVASAKSANVASAVAVIDRNVDDYYEDRIDHATFTARQRVAWDAIEASGIRADVLRSMDARVPRCTDRPMPIERTPNSYTGAIRGAR